MSVLVGEARKIPAFLRRDFLTMLSYRAAFVGDLLAIAVQAVTFGFIAKIVDPSALPSYNGVQAGYNFDFLVRFDPSATSGNTPLMWTATSAPGTFLEPTSGAGPDAFALIQLAGGTEVIGGQNIESGFYVAAVPEPSTYALMLAGLGVVAYGIRRRRK